MGLCNHYATYVHLFSELAAPLQELLKVPREQGKAGSKTPIHIGERELAAFHKLKGALVEGLQLYHVDVTKPFVLRTDASDYAIGATLEQFPTLEGEPTLEDLKRHKPVAVAFMSRKLTSGQRKR